jgi:hypothetical protein
MGIIMTTEQEAWDVLIKADKKLATSPAAEDIREAHKKAWFTSRKDFMGEALIPFGADLDNLKKLAGEIKEALDQPEFQLQEIARQERVIESHRRNAAEALKVLAFGTNLEQVQNLLRDIEFDSGE